MSEDEQTRLEAAGWKSGDATDFLGLSPDEEAQVAARLQREASIPVLRERLAMLRAEVSATEQALADAYGTPIDLLASFLCKAFDYGEMTRWAGYLGGEAVKSALPSTASPRDMSRAIAVALYDTQTTVGRLRASLVGERPRRVTEIDAALVEWRWK